jgi:hypothetical protein
VNIGIFSQKNNKKNVKIILSSNIKRTILLERINFFFYVIPQDLTRISDKKLRKKET